MCLFCEYIYYNIVTFSAWGPLALLTILKLTTWFSSNNLNSLVCIAEKCTNTSSPPSTDIKPNPFSLLNYFTIPFVTKYSMTTISMLL